MIRMIDCLRNGLRGHAVAITAIVACGSVISGPAAAAAQVVEKAPASAPAYLQVAASANTSKTPLVLTQGGTPDSPAVFDGNGLVIDLGIDVTGENWKKEGDLWTSRGPLLMRTPLIAGQFAGLFVDEVPISIPRDLDGEKVDPLRKEHCYVAPEKLKHGQMGYSKDGSLYFRWPVPKAPGHGRVILPPPVGMSCVTIACSHIIVRNVTAKYASNDGFNIHGKWIGVRFVNVRALSNADEGISAHDDVSLSVEGAEVAWNGSSAGGIADVGRSVSRYLHCRVHDNLGAAFYFSGKRHVVTDTEIFNQDRDFVIRSGTTVSAERVNWRRLTDGNRAPNH
jgi:hypothetical protein